MLDKPLLARVLTLFEYLERRKRLQTPSEKSKLLSEVPKVTADLLEPEATPQDQEHDIEQRDTSPILVHGSEAAGMYTHLITKQSYFKIKLD